VTPAPERVGLFGGTFDPVHVGHVVAAAEARHQLQLDRVLLVVAADPWQKRGRVIASAQDRLAMVRAAVDGIEGLEASRIEIDRAGETFSIDTVEQLAHTPDGGPDRSLFLVVGADVAARLESWHRVDELRRAVTLAVVGREDELAHDTSVAATAGWNVQPVSMPRLDISSTDIRRRIAQGAPIDGLVPPGVIRVMRDRRLYTPA
jgi:nicotinate-nucleotide adenylyltransferase